MNSSAMLLFCWDRGHHPDWVVFSDTGSEWPETYEHLHRVEAWCASVGWPFARTRWERVRRPRTGFEPVHDNCLRTAYLPSRAYGYAGCTTKWKIQPAQKWRKLHGFEKSTIALGYDFGEKRRTRKVLERRLEGFWYPLLAWGLDRGACVERLSEAGWGDVRKSSCFCCPSMKTEEWTDLQRLHPGLFEIAQRIEKGARSAGNAVSASIFRSVKDCVWCSS